MRRLKRAQLEDRKAALPFVVAQHRALVGRSIAEGEAAALRQQLAAVGGHAQGAAGHGSDPAAAAAAAAAAEARLDEMRVQLREQERTVARLRAAAADTEEYVRSLERDVADAREAADGATAQLKAASSAWATLSGIFGSAGGGAFGASATGARCAPQHTAGAAPRALVFSSNSGRWHADGRTALSSLDRDAEHEGANGRDYGGARKSLERPRVSVRDDDDDDEENRGHRAAAPRGGDGYACDLDDAAPRKRTVGGQRSPPSARAARGGDRVPRDDRESLFAQCGAMTVDSLLDGAAALASDAVGGGAGGARRSRSLPTTPSPERVRRVKTHLAHALGGLLEQQSEFIRQSLDSGVPFDNPPLADGACLLSSKAGRAWRTTFSCSNDVRGPLMDTAPQPPEVSGVGGGMS